MNPFLGEIRPFPYTYAPEGWLYCNGQLLSVSEYDALFSLIGTTYGGNGETTFAVPNLNGRVPIHRSSGTLVGTADGVESVTLNANQLPAHSHTLAVAGSAATTLPTGNSPAPGARATYGAANDLLASDSLTGAGGGASHSNMQPYLVLAYCISTQGIYPSSF